jgi:glycosyltransferase involved in cell wall biosynthesis
MHLAIDCRSVHRHMGGIGRAALELVRALAADSRGHRLTMIVGEGHDAALPAENVSVVTVDAAMIDERFEQVHLPSLLEELGADVYLNTTFSVPAVKTTPRQMSFIHDVVFEDRPDYVEPGLKSYLSRWSRFAATHADHVITDSDHARGRIQEVYGMDASRVTRVHLGISSSCFETPDDREIARVRAKYSLDQPFVLYLGTVEIKKGILELLRGYRQAVDLGLPHTLVLAGGRGGPALDLEDEIRIVGCVGRVRYLGFVDEADKKPLLKAADAFVYPSLYEGFGFPPLEAMALGVPCVVSDQTSLPEVVGTAALLTRVQAAGEFGKALVRAAQDDEFRRVAAVDGPARAREFSWRSTAAQVLDVCERVGAN